MLPIFKSHYSVGRSILTLEDKDELEPTSPDSIVSICLNHKIKRPILVDDSMGGFLEAYTNFTKHKINFIFGLRVTVCDDLTKKDEESRLSESKVIVFMKSSSGYEKLIKLYSTAAKEGFYYYPRTDYKNLEEVWGDDLQLCIPFYDSYVYNNSFTNNICYPKLNFTKLTYFVENNNLILDHIVKEKVLSLKEKTQEVKSIYYYKDSDFKSYLTFRCINNRSSLDKPELLYMSSDKFSFESWAKENDIKIVAPKEPEVAPPEKETSEDLDDKEESARRLSTGIVEFDIPKSVIEEAETRGKNLGSLKGSILKGKGNTTGYVGQIMFQKIFGGVDTDEESNTKKFRFDVSFKGEGWEIKTKNTTLNIPMNLDFDASISCNTKQQNFDKVAFFRVNLETRKGWFGGYATYDQWMENRFFAGKGQVDSSNGMKEHCDCHKMKYGALLSLPNPVLEISSNG